MHTVRRLAFRSRHILSSTSRPGTAVPSAAAGHSARRSIHQLQQLPYNIEDGLGDFLSPEALHMIAVEYQQGLLTRLNEQVKGTGMANQSVTDTVISTASDRSYALAFNYASQALNNSFFLAGLAPPPPPPQSNEDPVRENTNLATAIRMNFGDIAQLKSTFSAAAMGMINNGWVWLVCDEFGSMQVVATFGSGTLLVRSRRHMSTGELPILGEPMDSVYHGAYYKKSTPQKVTPISSSLRPAHNPSSPTFGSSPTSGIDTPPTTTPPPDRSRALHYSLRRALDAVPNLLSSRDMTISGQLAAGRKERIGDILAPLLCVSVQEHAWVGTGYGIWGKEEYLKRFWSVVNWERVGRAYSLVLNSSQFR